MYLGVLHGGDEKKELIAVDVLVLTEHSVFMQVGQLEGRP